MSTVIMSTHDPVQDNSLNPGSGDKVTFKVATHIATAKAAEMAAGPNSKYAGGLSITVAGVMCRLT